MQCLNCNNDMTQTGNRPRKYCSDKCRMAHVRSGRKPKVDSKANNGGAVLSKPNKNVDSSESSRRNRNSEEAGQELGSVLISDLKSGPRNLPLTLDDIKPGSYSHYQAYPDKYAKRENPEKLNWGQPLTFHELQASPFKANRVSIPGDWDFEVENVA